MPVLAKKRDELTAAELAVIQRNSEDTAKYIEALTECINNSGAAQRKPFIMCREPNSLKIAGVNAKNVIIYPDVVDKCMATVATDKIKHPHNLGSEVMSKLADELRNPALIMHSRTVSGGLVAVTSLKDYESRPVVIALAQNNKGGIEVCKVASSYGRNDFENWMQRNFDENRLIAYNDKKSNELFRFLPGLQSALEEQQLISFNDSIAYSFDSVKGFDEKKLQEILSEKPPTTLPLKPTPEKKYKPNPAYEAKIKEARGADLVEYFRRRSYTVEKTGNEFYIKEIPGLAINQEHGKWFHHYSEVGGSNSIDCLTKVLDVDFKKAVEELSGGRVENFSFQNRINDAHKSATAQPKKDKEFVLPEPAENNNRVIAYLTQTRKIPPEIVYEFIRNKKLYQEKNTGNAVFPHSKNGKIIGAELEGTGSTSRFKKNLSTPGEVSSFAIAFSPKTTKAYVFESSVDLMSFYAMVDRKNNNLEGVALVSMSGLRPSIIKDIEARGIEILSCVDNDEKGLKFESTHGLKRAGTLLEKEGVKDWNDLWIKKVEESFQSEKVSDISDKSAVEVGASIDVDIEEIGIDD